MAAAVSAVLIGTTVAVVAGQDDRVAVIDGVEVTRDEVRFYTDHVAAGSDPLDVIGTDRALLALAREHGLTDIVTFADLQDALAATNAHNADAVAAGEVVYGLTTYSLAEFRSRMMTELRTQLIDTLSAAAELVVTDADIESYFTAHAEDWSAGATTYRTTYLEIPESAGLGAAEVAAIVAEAGGLEPASDRVDGASVRSADIEDDTVNLGPAVMAELRSLVPEALTSAQPHDGGWRIYRLEGVQVDRAAALEMYRSRIRSVLLEERFDTLLTARVEALDIELVSSDWNSVTTEGHTS